METIWPEEKQKEKKDTLHWYEAGVNTASTELEHDKPDVMKGSKIIVHESKTELAHVPFPMKRNSEENQRAAHFKLIHENKLLYRIIFS